MTSAIPYDPDDFDNNPFAEQSTHSLITDQQQQQHEHGHAQVNPYITTVQPQPHEQLIPPKSSINDSADDSPLNRRATEEELKKYIPERFMKSRFSMNITVEDIEKNGNGSNAFKNPIFKINATVKGLPGYRKTVYKNVRRTYKECELFNKFLKLNNLEVFIPALPTIPTLYNFGSDEFKTSLIDSIQLWFNRLTANAILIRNAEFILFLENNDFHYSPSKTKPSNIVMATGLKRRTLKQLQTPYDESQELASLRPLIKATYVNSTKIKENLINVDRLDKKLSHQNSDLFNKLQELAETEPDEDMQKTWLKLSKNLNIINEIDLIKKHTASSILMDYFELVIDDTYTIKESLTNRHLLMRELINAEESTKKKSAIIAKLKNKSVIDPARVDEAILSLEHATLAQNKLHRDVVRTTYNMLLEQDEYLEFLTMETRQIFKKLSLKTIENERKKLAVLENFKNDLRQISSIKGGLARLGRENYPISPTKFSKSQTSQGDSWSSRTRKRYGSSSSTPTTTNGGGDIETSLTDESNVDLIVEQLNSGVGLGDDDDNDNNDEDDNDDDDDDGKNAVVDAKSAASLLGPSTF